MPATETLTLRATAIAGQRYADDYEVFWRGMSIGRIRKAAGTHAAPLIEEAERSVDILLKLALNFLALAWPDIFLPVEQPLLSCK